MGNVIPLFKKCEEPDYDDLKEAWFQQSQKLKKKIYDLHDFKKRADVYSLKMTLVNKYLDRQINHFLYPIDSEIMNEPHFYLAIAEIAKLRSTT
jgi:hypothetical protein